MSYSHKDKALVARLLPHLRVLQTSGIARIYCDLEIRGGDKWRTEIEKEIDGATLILCLLSADYLSSPFVNSNEVPRIRERQAAGVRVVPVLLRSCAWQICDWLEEHQVYMQDGKPLDLGTPEEVEQHFADLTMAVFNLLAEDPDFDPPAAVLPGALVDNAIEVKGASVEEAKILQAGDRFRRKALLEFQLSTALERLVAERTWEVPREAVVHEAAWCLITGGGISAAFSALASQCKLDEGPTKLITRADVEEMGNWPDLVVGWSSRVSDRAAIVFSVEPYQRLAAWDLLDAAWQRAKNGLVFNGHEPVVHVYQREELSERLAGRALPSNGWVYTQTPIRMIYTFDRGWAKATDDGGWHVDAAGAAINSGRVIKIVLSEDNPELDCDTVLHLELNRDWSSSAPAISPRARSPYCWPPFIFQEEWQSSPGVNGDIIDDGLDGIFLPNGICGRGGDERRGPFEAVAWGDIGYLNTGNGEAPYVC